MNGLPPQQIEVKLKNIEDFYAIKDQQGNKIDFASADGKALFNHLRHNCTTYEDILGRIRSQQGYISEAQLKLVKQAAAEVIIEHFRNDNENLQLELSKQREEKKRVISVFQNFKNEVMALLQKLGVNTISAGINTLDDLLQKVATAEQSEKAYQELQTKHKNSTMTFGRYNDAYRVHEVLTLDYLEMKKVDPEIVGNLRKLYKTQSPRTAIPVFCQFTESEESVVIKRIKGKIYYTDPSKLKAKEL
jgi:hypothetical protein